MTLLTQLQAEEIEKRECKGCADGMWVGCPHNKALKDTN